MTFAHRIFVRSQAARFVAAGVAIAAGVMVLTAPPGNAIPESTIKSECDNAGGDYTIVTDGEHSYSRCCYLDIKGNKHCDHYTDGKYTYETSNNTLEQPTGPATPAATGRSSRPAGDRGHASTAGPRHDAVYASAASADDSLPGSDHIRPRGRG